MRIIERKGGELSPPVKPADDAGQEVRSKYESDLKAYEDFYRDVEKKLAAQQLEAIEDYRSAVGDLIDNVRNVTMPLQVTQLQSQLVSAQSSLLTQRLSYQNNIDTFKFDQLGLPTDMILSIDESMLKPFELIDEQLLQLRGRLNC